MAIAVGFAHNTVNDIVRAYINGVPVVAAGAIALSAQFTPVIEALSIGGSYASGQQTSVALSGAGSTNNVDAQVLAFIANSGGATPGVQATNGAVSLTANDGSSSFAHAGAVALAWTNDSKSTTSTSVSVGVSVAENFIGQGAGHTVEATIEGSKVTASGDVDLTATSTADIETLAVGGSASGATGAASTKLIAVAGAGAYAANTISGTIEAHIASDSDVTTTAGSGGDIDLTSTDSTKLIRADAYGIALAYASATAAAATTVSAAIGVAISQNKVENSVKAYIDASKALADAGIVIDADASPDVRSFALGVAASLARGTGLTGALALTGSAATNSVDDTIAAYINNSNGADGIQANGGGVSLTATDDSIVWAVAGGFALAGSESTGESTAFAVAVGASIAENKIGTGDGQSVKAYINDATVVANGAVEVEATSTAVLYSVAIGGAVAGRSGRDSPSAWRPPGRARTTRSSRRSRRASRAGAPSRRASSGRSRSRPSTAHRSPPTPAASPQPSPSPARARTGPPRP